MLYWAVVFFIIAIIAAVLGFTGIAVAAGGNCKDSLLRLPDAFYIVIDYGYTQTTTGLIEHRDRYRR